MPVMNPQIQLLQFFVCQEFRQKKQDFFEAEGLQTNLYVPKFPFHFRELYAVTCWLKDRRFHKEVIEYTTEDGRTARSPHMDIEPLEGSVLYRWHTHRFPTDFPVGRPGRISLHVILDRKPVFESHLLIEALSGTHR